MKLHQALASGVFVAAAAVLGVTGGTASALTAVVNGSFESAVVTGPFATINTGGSDMTGWQVTSGSVDHIGSYWVSSNGDQSVDLSGNSAGTISQTLTTVPGHTYTVNFDLAGNPAGGPVEKSVLVSAADDSSTFTFDTTGASLNVMNWEPQEFSFTATSTSTALTFASLTPGFFGPALDNVTVTDVLHHKEQCKNGGWMTYSSPSFKNQGDCVSYMQSSENAIGNRADNQ